MFRVVLHPVQEFEYDSPEKCIAGRLLWEQIKVGRSDAEFDTFQHDVRACTDISVKLVARTICADVDSASSLIILNLDEINVLLDVRNPHGGPLLTRILRSLRICSREGDCYFAVILTSTAILRLRDVLKVSHTDWHEFKLPLLGVQHMCEVVLDIARRCRAAAEQDVNAEQDIDFSWLSHTTPASLMRTYPLFAFVLRLLGGNCRFLELLLFRLGYCNDQGGFRPLQFLSSLRRLDDSRFLSDIRQQTAAAIHSRYPRFLTSWGAVGLLIPQLIAMTLFDVPVRRSTRFEHATSGDQISVEQLEQMGIIVIDSIRTPGHGAHTASSIVPARISSDFPPSLAPPQRTGSAVRIISSPDPNDVEWVLLKMPFIWLQRLFPATMPTESLRLIPLLSSHSSFLSPDDNERLTLTIIMLKMFYYVTFPELRPWFLRSSSLPPASSSSSSSPSSSSVFSCHIPLSVLVPLRAGQPDVQLRLDLRGQEDRQHPYWNVTEADYQLDKYKFIGWLSKAVPESPAGALFIMNKVRAAFADSIITTTPVLFLQDKQQVTERREMMVRDAAGHKQQLASVHTIQKEHSLCDLPEVPHLFIYTTDLPLSPDVEDEMEEEVKDEVKGKRRKVKRKLRDNEVVVHRGNNQQFYGDLVTFLKACCVDVRAGIATQIMVGGQGEEPHDARRTTHHHLNLLDPTHHYHRQPTIPATSSTAAIPLLPIQQPTACPFG